MKFKLSNDNVAWRCSSLTTWFCDVICDWMDRLLLEHCELITTQYKQTWIRWIIALLSSFKWLYCHLGIIVCAIHKFSLNSTFSKQYYHVVVMCRIHMWIIELVLISKHIYKFKLNDWLNLMKIYHLKISSCDTLWGELIDSNLTVSWFELRKIVTVIFITCVFSKYLYLLKIPVSSQNFIL